ncbi:MAG: hypothetical protein EOO90_01915 [Pedobacter sp.]|nr:MAG: hypothetical protein EOO90_01915 [Pedobacter sp.]
MSTNILIDLEKSSNAQFLETGALIHQREFKTVKSWIIASLAKINLESPNQPMAEKDMINYERLHETITVLGSRGSGKTTFMLSLLKEFKNPIYGVEVFNIIDPTLFEEKGHIFLDIISRIKGLVDEKLDGSETNPLSVDYAKRRAWNEHLKKLAHGLPLLDGVGGQMTEPAWQDAEFIMNNGIQAVTSARNLEINFHRLIDEALKILGKKAFIVAFDDIDIDFIKGWRVMETIRKYFTSPKLITLMSGDLKLYSKSIRKHQWKNFGKALLMNEAETLDKMDDFRELVTKMESQYMQKVMKPERRVHLNTLSEKLNIEGDDFKIFVKSTNGSEEIRKFYELGLKNFGINKPYVAETYITFLLGLPLRTQIQFLSSLVRKNKNSDTEEFRKEDYYPANILDPFYSDLLERQVDIALAVSTPKMLNVVILNFLLKEKIIDEGYQVQPTITDISISSCLTALSLYYSQAVKKNGYIIFDYLIKVGYTRNLFTFLGYEGGSGKISSTLSPSIEGFYKFSHIHIDKVLRDTVGNMTAYMRAFLNIKQENQDPWGGTIPLPELALDGAFMNATLLQKHLSRIPLSICKHPETNGTFPIYSIYALLATAGEFLKDGVRAQAAFMEQSQVRNHIMPEFETSNLKFRTARQKNSQLFDAEDKQQAENFTKDLDELTIKLDAWKKAYKKMSKEIPPYVLGKASTRTFYTLSYIESESKEDNLGDMIRNRILGFLNAILIEDAKEYIEKSSGLNVSNTDDPEIFYKNLKWAYREDKVLKQLTFSRWMLSCPLLLSYLDDDTRKKIYEFIEVKYSKEDVVSIHGFLKKVELTSSKKQQPE